MAQPLVSIIVPTLSRLELLVQTIRSIILQDCTNIEVIISDNYSKDNTSNFLSQLEDSRFKVITRKFTLPLETNVNDAARHASGKYLLILSDDDLIPNNYISTMVSAFEADDAVQVGLGRRVLIDGESKILHQAAPLSAASYVEPAETWLTQYFASSSAHNHINTVFSTFYRRSEWLNSGVQPALSASFFADTIPFVGVNSSKSKVFYSPDAVFLYRMHQNQGSRQVGSVGKQTYLGMFQFFERLKPALGDFSTSDMFLKSIIKYILMMFFGSCAQFVAEEAIKEPDLYEIFWGYLKDMPHPAARSTGPLHADLVTKQRSASNIVQA
ncbi:glycosyltransferase family 2 protein [Methylobacterium pseudosasicola]|uniref:Glycosyl transferase family 2 n=1 Tax=Methylobacterium pseudosasicola TaxID=582667 RepID=A0A1I4JNF8_9HYPH|nr:glycosyltransferase family 2 protein [Methylobacterium pseudosasicola]SFL67666.1 Glycosyl transferase family 2 [Methylobacterium pseudosasicola]